MGYTPERKRQWRKQRQAAGICIHCGDVAIPQRAQCRVCVDKLLDARLGLSKARARVMLNSCRLRAKKGGVQCTLTAAWLLAKLEVGTCELTRLPFASGRLPGSHNHPFAPSVDRIASGRDYTPDNCRVILCALNSGLSDWGQDIYKTVAQAYLAHN